MIDTLKFLIPIKDEVYLEKIKSRLTRIRKKDLITNEIKFEIFNKQIEVGSYDRKVSLYLHMNNPTGLFIEFSLPKQYYGNNVEMIHPYDIKKILNNCKADLSKQLKLDLLPVTEWILYRLDVCHNWTFESTEKCQSLMNFVQRIDFPRKEKHTYDTSVFYSGTAYTVKFYLKGDEFMAHDFKEIFEKDEEKAVLLKKWSEKVLRFEVSIKKRYLAELLGNDKPTVADISDEKQIEEILQHYLSKVFKYINRKNMKYENVRQLIEKNFKPKKALDLYQFYKGYYFNKDEKFHIKKGLSSTTIWRYKTDLRNIGVSFEENIGDSNFVSVEELVIPSDKAIWRMLDYQLINHYS